MATEFVTKLTVLSASCLPRTDLFSKIDSYVIIQAGSQRFQTRVIDDDENPHFDEVFYPLLNAAGAAGRNSSEVSAPSFLTGSIQISLYDKDTFSDSLVATASIQLDGKTFQDLYRMNLPLVYTKRKYSGQSYLLLGMEGFVQSYRSMRCMFAALPGFLFSDQKRACYFPIHKAYGMAYLAVEYEEGEVDIKVYETNPNRTAMFVDMMFQSGHSKTKLRKREYPQGLMVVPGLVVFEEIKLDDVKLGQDFGLISVLCFDSIPLGNTNADQVVSAHGWKGALDFKKAARTLHNVLVDLEEEEIYMEVDRGETVLVVDYDDGNVDIKLCVLSTLSTADKGYELTIRGTKINKKSMELFTPAKPKLGGQLLVSRLFELDDVPYGTSLDKIEIQRFQLLNQRQMSVQGICRIHG